MPRSHRNLVADSTFYLFFIDDTNNSDSLCKILEIFTAQLSPTIHKELHLKNKDAKLKKLIESSCNVFQDSRIKYAEALRPVFSKEELQKGEHELIAIAVLCNELKIELILVIDDEGPRKIISNHFAYLSVYLTRTGRFIEKCYSQYDVLKKDEAIKLINDMKKSKFHIDKRSIDQLLGELEK